MIGHILYDLYAAMRPRSPNSNLLLSSFTNLKNGRDVFVVMAWSIVITAGLWLDAMQWCIVCTWLTVTTYIVLAMIWYSDYMKMLQNGISL